MKKHTYKKDVDDHRHKAHIKKSRRLHAQLWILTGLSLVAVLLGLWMMKDVIRHSSGSAQKSLEDALQVSTSASNQRTVASDYGFVLGYNSSEVHATGVQANPTGGLNLIVGDDLNEKRDYGAVQFYTYNTVPLVGATTSNPIWQMEVITNLQKDIFAEGRKKYGESTSDQDLAVKLFAPKVTTNSYTTITPSQLKQESIVISGITYIKTIYKLTDEKFPTASRNLSIYTTVQHGRPYAVQLDFDNHMTDLSIAPLIRILNTIEYPEPSSSASYISTRQASKIKLAVAETGLSKDVVNTPNKLEAEELLIVARNQPGVVRIGTTYCANFDLLLPDGRVAMSVVDACGAGIGSGSIVSNDGYISTNGHVTTGEASSALSLYIDAKLAAKDQGPLNTYLQYLVYTGVASSGDLQALLLAIQSGDSRAYNTLLYLTSSIPHSAFKVSSSTSQYGIQLSNEPIRLERKGTHLSIPFTDKVVEAKFVADNYDGTAGMAGKFSLETYKGSDVAILKMEGSNFPVVKLGTLTDVQKGSVITAIGFPAFVDGGFDSKQEKTIPTATAGTVTYIEDTAGGGHFLIYSNTQIAQGNSGGPVFNTSGLQVGLVTYGGSTVDPLAGVEKLSDNSVMRNIDDYKALLTSKSITLNSDSKVSSLWYDLIGDFEKSKYKHAIKVAKKIEAIYPKTYLTASFTKTAEAEIAAGHSKDSLLTPVVYAGIAAIIVFGGGAVVTIIKLRKHRKSGHQLGYYATSQPQTPVAPMQAQPYAYPSAPAPIAPQPQQFRSPPTPPVMPPTRPVAPVQQPIQPQVFTPQVIQPSAAVQSIQVTQPDVVPPQRIQ